MISWLWDTWTEIDVESEIVLPLRRHFWVWQRHQRNEQMPFFGVEIMPKSMEVHQFTHTHRLLAKNWNFGDSSLDESWYDLRYSSVGCNIFDIAANWAIFLDCSNFRPVDHNLNQKWPRRCVHESRHFRSEGCVDYCDKCGFWGNLNRKSE